MIESLAMKQLYAINAVRCTGDPSDHIDDDAVEYTWAELENIVEEHEVFFGIYSMPSGVIK